MSTCALQLASCFSWLTGALVRVSAWLERAPQINCENCRFSCCSTTDIHYERLNSYISDRSRLLYTELARRLEQRKDRFTRYASV